jgi:hypothetical protein
VNFVRLDRSGCDATEAWRDQTFFSQLIRASPAPVAVGPVPDFDATP